MTKTRYQNSVCRPGHLHDFIPQGIVKEGLLERCTRCGKQMHFPFNVPNHIYLSFHIRSAIQRDDPLFAKEYPQLV
jgi:hypothetical protein